MIDGYFSRDLEDLEDFDARSLSITESPALVTGAGAGLVGAISTAAKQALLTPSATDAAAAAAEQKFRAAAEADGASVPQIAPTMAPPGLPRTPPSASGEPVRAELPAHHRRRGIVAVMICYGDGRRVVAL